MNKNLYILLIGVLVLIISPDLFSQRIQGAVMGGFNLTQVDGDEVYGFKKLGANVGLGAVVPFGKNFQFSLETVFSQKGANQKAQYLDSLNADTVYTGEYKLALNYLEIPFLVMYNDKDIITAGAGFSYGRLVKVNEYEHGKKVETTSINTGPYNRNDFSILADLRFRVYKKLKVNLRYSYSLAKIRTRDFYDTNGKYYTTRKQYNNVITLRLIYMFNEQPPLADSKK
jgi:hypothetical protein